MVNRYAPKAPGASDAEVLARELDRLWFQANPGRHHRIRRAIVGELPEATAEDYVVFRQVRPGVRIRVAFLLNKPLPDGEAPEGFAEALLQSILEQRARREQFHPLDPLYETWSSFTWSPGFAPDCRRDHRDAH